MEGIKTTRHPKIHVSTQTWDTVVCRFCVETRAWLETPLIQELQQYRNKPVAILSKTELILLQQNVTDLRRKFIEHEQTHERRLDHEEILRLRQRRTLLEAKLRANYRELRAAKENIKILQMIIIKLERHRRAVIEAVKLDALLPSTCLSSVITDEEQWIVRRIVSRFLTKAAKTDLIKVTDPSAVSPPSSVCSRQNTDIDIALRAHASCKAISQSSLIWPSNEISEASIVTIDSEEVNRRYELAEMMVAEEKAAKANDLQNQESCVTKTSNTSIHIILPAGSSVCIAETKEEVKTETVTSSKSCEIVYVSPACTPPQKISETHITKEKSSKVEFTPITSAHLLFHTEEGVKKVNPFLEALKKISSDLAKFALPIIQSNEDPVEIKDDEKNTEEGHDSSRASCDKNSSTSEVELVYFSPTSSPVQASSTTVHDTSSGKDDEELSQRQSWNVSEPEKDTNIQQKVSLNDITPQEISSPILKALEKISNDIDFYTKPPCNKKCKEKNDLSTETEYRKALTNVQTEHSLVLPRQMESHYTVDPYACRLSRRCMCVLDIPYRRMDKTRPPIEPPPRYGADVNVLSKSILRNLTTKPPKSPERKQLLGKEIDPSDFFDQFS